MSCLYLLLLGFLLAGLKNTTPAITCGKGYESSQGKCVDDDECNFENPICGENAVCYNTEGSYYCQCETGYEMESKTVNFTQDVGGECIDINECEKNICGVNAYCGNTLGSYYCTCNSGFVSSNGQEKFNASHNVTCIDAKKSSEDKTVGAADAEGHKTSDHVMDAESSARQLQFNPTVSTFLPVILWMLTLYQ